MAIIQQGRAKVQRLVDEAVQVAEAPDGRSFLAAERAIWAATLKVGGALLALWLAHRSSGPRAARYAHVGVEYELMGRETVEVGSRFGRVEYERPVGRPVGAPRGARDFPLDRELGLPALFTMGVVLLIARLAAQMAFKPARELFRDLLGWTPSTRAALRMVDAVGSRARAFLDSSPAPDDDGEVLVILADGKGAPSISSREYARRCRPRKGQDKNRRKARRAHRREVPRARRGPGKKSKNAKMAAVGVLYTLRRTPDGGLDGPVNKRTYATFEGYRALFDWIKAEATKRGYGTTKFTKVLFIADGAKVLWTLQAEYFPDACQCVDWFHVVEKLWAAGKAICRGTRRERQALEAWVAEQKKRLRKGQVDAVLATLEQALESIAATGPGNKFRRAVLAKTLAYFREHSPRMLYAQLRKEDLDIGSGVVEGAVRHLVGVRLDGPGMRWGRDRAEAVLHLRCVLINGLWADFEEFLDDSHHALRLKPRPVPARTHDAVPAVGKKAA